MERIDMQQEGLQRLAKNVLSWITCAKRPLTTLELRHALAVRLGDLKLDEQNIPRIEDMVAVCAGLVTVDNESGIIRLVHYTTQEYFERTQKDWFPTAESDITMICVTYVSFSAFESGPCQNNDLKERLESNPLYDYAATNWGHHARNALTFWPGVIEFLQCEAKVLASSEVLLAKKVISDWHDAGKPRPMTGLQLASYFGINEAVRTLLMYSKLYLGNSYDRTSLLLAAENGHHDVVQLLVDNGTELETRDYNSDWTPLLWAANKGHLAMLELLLDKGSEIESRKGDEGPLSCAAEIGHHDIVQLLLKNGAKVEDKPEVKGKNAWTPLILAAEKGRHVVLQLLLKKGAKLEIKGRNGQTPLMLAAENRQYAVVQLLVEYGAELEVKDNYGQTP
jgi:ankyrin repeat protein